MHLKMHDITAEQYKEKFNVSSLMSEETIKKISEATSGQNNPMHGVHRFGDDSPNFGKKFSDDHKKRISETRKKNKIACGENNPMYGKHHSKESIKKMSESICNQINNGRNLYANHEKGYFHSDRLNEDVWYDSSYEKIALKIFEKDLNIVKFGRSYMKVPYIYKEKEKFSVPDFRLTFVDGSEKIIEIKPERKLKLIEKERIKVEAISIYCIANGLLFETWTEKDLGIK